MNPLERVRSGCRAVADSARHVRINHDLITDYALSLLPALVEGPKLDQVTHYVGHGNDTVAFILTLDAINFGSGYFPHLHKRPGMSGYFTIASSLSDLFNASGPLSADQLQELGAEDCAEVFGQDMSDPVIAELMGLFSRALNDLGSYLIRRFHGSFTELVEEAAHSASRLVDILCGMPLFRDEERYRGIDVPFYKRAQITVSDLALAFEEGGYGEFHDLDRLTIFADNMVPHVLRMDGILSYDEDLLTRIEREELIPAGSEEEIEIRACAVHAAELIVRAINETGEEVTAQQLDNALWNRGQSAEYKGVPRHRTRSAFY